MREIGFGNQSVLGCFDFFVGKNGEMVFNKISCEIIEIGKIHNSYHVPIGINLLDGKINVDSLDNWFSGRKIPANRDQLQNFLDTFEKPGTNWILAKSFGLRLSDHYWVKPIDKNIDWDEINFFENEFSEDVGDLLKHAAAEGGKFKKNG